MNCLFVKSFVHDYSNKLNQNKLNQDKLSKITQLVSSPSKSQTLRAILFASLAIKNNKNNKNNISKIKNYLDSPDTQAMITACRLIGAEIKYYIDNNDGCDYLEITGVQGNPRLPENIIDAGNSGIVYRFVMAIVALIDGYSIITGDESIRARRPASALLGSLRQLGAVCISTQNNDRAPIIIKGPIKAGIVTMETQDSQPVSALIIASIFLTGNTEIKLINPGELPWINLTLKWLDKFNIKYTNNNFENIIIYNPDNKNKNLIKSFNYIVPGDFSSVLYPVAACIITGVKVKITNLDFTDAQGDKQVLDVLISMGADIILDQEQKTLEVNTRNLNLLNQFNQINGQIIDINNMIDSLPILAVIACYASSETQLLNCEIARHKESDRLSAITQELTKMGADITESKDKLIIRPSVLHHAVTSSHQDHRIAMSLVIAALGVGREIKKARDNNFNNLNYTTIENTDCIKKSYANFINDITQLVDDCVTERIY